MIGRLLGKLLGPKRSGLVPREVVELIGDLAQVATTVAEFRQAVARKAQAGDLDAAFLYLKGAHARAQAYIRKQEQGR